MSACSKPAEGAYEDAAISTHMVDLSEEPVKKSTAVPGQELALPQLAYEYTYTMEAPLRGLDTLIASHQSLCDQAGPQNCLMITSNSYGNKASGQKSQTMALRVSPQWLKTFQAGLEGDLKKSRGQLTSQNVNSEDLSLQIVDSEARLKNKTALRDRLIDIIKSKPGKIADLIEAETTLANVQAEIDSLQSSLAVMRKRVATVRLTLEYRSETLATPGSAFSPVVDSLTDFTRVAMSSLGAIILVIAALLPFGLIVVPLGWFGWRLWRKRKAKSKPTAG
ncbi:DUF4349 domain-containing protein [Asticcacaulis sp. ZE23SCel15]|uniref:DUF4349 domain-containing protein n=1 Tax=Asticcacaulis sp. ZE23SCel15 TaxID=3059027 RepID=UPI00265E4BCB|nr:DUF4349 domain-containing protein [Asticcacaulis sp. ZE23SCel15]WKL57462.1 DUF4349 domain-containing protein [Asticcacaulis sp. ZE23SCel15]